MDIPKGFQTGIGVEEQLEELLKRPKGNPKTISELLFSCDDFLQKMIRIDHKAMYLTGTNLAREFDYTKYDLEGLSEKITISKDYRLSGGFLGFYLSALTNKILTEEETVILRPRIKLFGLGLYQQKGIVIIKGHTGTYTGAYMNGGILMIKGSVDSLTGFNKKGGDIIVEGRVGDYTADHMEGGRILVVNGHKKNPLDYFDERGEVIINDNLKRMYLPRK